MQDLTKTQQDNNQPKTEPSKPKGLLTKNRFWNIVFLFAVPAQIYLAALMWSAPMLLLPLATIIFIFNFAPVDKSLIDNKDPHAVKALRYAAHIWFFTCIAFGFAASKILGFIGIPLGMFGFGEVFFFIFLVPISILCYANIPLSSCFRASNTQNIHGSSGSVFNNSSHYSSTESRSVYTNPSYSWMNGNIFHRK